MITVGFVGMGLIGARRAKIAKTLGYRIAFMVDPDPKRLNALEAQGSCLATSLQELASRGFEQPDAVLVAVPHDVALETCVWALERGASVLCEKPMGISLEQAQKIAVSVKAAGKQFCAGFNYRYLPGVVALRKLVREGELGELFRVRMIMGHGGRPGMETEWKLERARAGGGALIDPGIHLIDLAQHIFGANGVESVALRRRFWKSDVEDECALTLRAPGGADVSIDVSLTSWRNQFVIEAYGSDGMAVLSGRGGNYGRQRLEYVNRWFWQGLDKRRVEDLGADDPSFEMETHAFLELVESGESDGNLSDADAGCSAIKVVQQAYGYNQHDFG
jgi:predicted dehydrogenase